MIPSKNRPEPAAASQTIDRAAAPARPCQQTAAKQEPSSSFEAPQNPLALRRYKSPVQNLLVIAMPAMRAVPQALQAPQALISVPMQRSTTIGFPLPLTDQQRRMAQRRLDTLETGPRGQGAPPDQQARRG